MCYLLAELVGKEVSLGEGTGRKLRGSRTGNLSLRGVVEMKACEIQKRRKNGQSKMLAFTIF